MYIKSNSRIKIAQFTPVKFFLETLHRQVSGTMIWKLLIIFFGLASARDHVEPEYLDQLRASGQDDKFAELLGIEKHLIQPDDSEQRSEGSKFNHASFLGDILLTEEQERNALDFNVYKGSRWPEGLIPFSLSGDFDANQRKIILDAVDKLNKKTSNLKLVQRTWQDDYVYVFSGNGCYSYLGKTGGQQALSLQKNGCVSTATVQHEFLHAAGFTHEQNRHDRDDHVDVLWDNIPSSWHSQYQKVGNGWRSIGRYDYYSIMHYPIWSPETYKDAFKVPENIDRNRLGKGCWTGDGVTGWDVYKIDTLYA